MGSSHSAPTLMEQLAAVRRELGLKDDRRTLLVQQVAAANKAAGIAKKGTLQDQVRRLVQETGASVDVGGSPLLESTPTIAMLALLALIVLGLIWHRRFREKPPVFRSGMLVERHPHLLRSRSGKGMACFGRGRPPLSRRSENETNYGGRALDDSAEDLGPAVPSRPETSTSLPVVANDVGSDHSSVTDVSSVADSDAATDSNAATAPLVQARGDVSPDAPLEEARETVAAERTGLLNALFQLGAASITSDAPQNSNEMPRASEHDARRVDVLVIICSPRAAPLMGAGPEGESVRTCIARNGGRVEIRTGCSAAQLREFLALLRPRMLLFVGHTDASHPHLGLRTPAFTDEDGGIVTIDPATITSMLRCAVRDGLEFVMFSGCCSGALGEAATACGLPNLCWPTMMLDNAGSIFSPAFFEYLVHPERAAAKLRTLLPCALEQAKLAVQAVPGCSVPGPGRLGLRTEKYAFGDPTATRPPGRPLPDGRIVVGEPLLSMPPAALHNLPVRQSETLQVSRPSLQEQLLEVAQGRRVVAIVGTAGVGKTELSTWLVHNAQTHRHFSGGIYCLTIGREPDLVAKRRELQAAFAAAAPAATPEPRLVVLSDVWAETDVQVFEELLGDGATLLFTTRNASLAREHAGGYDGGVLVVREMTEAQAVSLLSKHLGYDVDGDEVATTLVNRCYLLPAAVRAVAGLVARGSARVQRGNLRAALAYLETSEYRLVMMTVPATQPRYKYGTIFDALEAALRFLSEELQTRCMQLGAFPQGERVPLSMLSMLWDEDPADALDELHQWHLVELHPPETPRDDPTVSLLDLHRDFLRCRGRSLLPTWTAAVHRTSARFQECRRAATTLQAAARAMRRVSAPPDAPSGRSGSGRESSGAGNSRVSISSGRPGTTTSSGGGSSSDGSVALPICESPVGNVLGISTAMVEEHMVVEDVLGSLPGGGLPHQSLTANVKSPSKAAIEQEEDEQAIHDSLESEHSRVFVCAADYDVAHDGVADDLADSGAGVFDLAWAQGLGLPVDATGLVSLPTASNAAAAERSVAECTAARLIGRLGRRLISRQLAKRAVEERAAAECAAALLISRRGRRLVARQLAAAARRRAEAQLVVQPLSTSQLCGAMPGVRAPESEVQELRREVQELRRSFAQTICLLTHTMFTQVRQGLALRFFAHLASPCEVLSLINKAVGAVGAGTVANAPSQQLGSCFFIRSRNGLIVITNHHVLLDAKWKEFDPTDGMILHVGVGETIDWQYMARVELYSPSSKPPRNGAPDHRRNPNKMWAKKPKPYLDFAALELTGRRDGQSLTQLDGNLVHSPVAWERGETPVACPATYLAAANYRAKAGCPVAICGYGAQQPAGPWRRTMTGRLVGYGYDQLMGCDLLLIDAEGLGGHSGGAVVDLGTCCVLGVFFSSHVETTRVTDNRGQPITIDDIPLFVRMSTGGIHAAVPVYELQKFGPGLI